MVTKIKTKQPVMAPCNSEDGVDLGLPAEGHAAGSAAPSARMSKVDTAWLRMDGEHNLMMIVGVWILKPGLKLQEVSARIESRLLKFPRFGQRVHQDATGASWVTDAAPWR